MCQVARTELRKGVSEAAVIAALLAEYSARVGATVALAARREDNVPRGLIAHTVAPAEVPAAAAMRCEIGKQGGPPLPDVVAPETPPLPPPGTPAYQRSTLLWSAGGGLLHGRVDAIAEEPRKPCQRGAHERTRVLYGTHGRCQDRGYVALRAQ